MHHRDIPIYEPEVIAGLRRNLGPRLANLASTTSISRIVVRGIVLSSPYRIAKELQMMTRMVTWLSQDLVQEIDSITTDLRTVRKFHVQLGRELDACDLIVDQLEQACLHAHNGHNGLIITAGGRAPISLPPRAAVEFPVPF